MKPIKLEEAPKELQVEIQMRIKLEYKLVSLTVQRSFRCDGLGYEAILSDELGTFRILKYAEGFELLEDIISDLAIKNLIRIDPELRKGMKREIEQLEMFEMLEIKEKEQSE